MIFRKLTLTFKCVNKMLVFVCSTYLYSININADNYIVNNIYIKINDDKSIKQAKDLALEEGAKKAFTIIAKRNKHYNIGDKIKNYMSMIQAYEINDEKITDHYYKANFTYHLSDKSIGLTLNGKAQEIVLVPLLKFNDINPTIMEENDWYKLWNEEWLSNDSFYLPNFDELKNVDFSNSNIIINDASAFTNLIKNLKSDCLIIAFADINYSLEKKKYFVRTKLKNFVMMNNVLKWQFDSKPIFNEGENIESLIKKSIASLLENIDKKEIIINATTEKNE